MLNLTLRELFEFRFMYYIPLLSSFCLMLCYLISVFVSLFVFAIDRIFWMCVACALAFVLHACVMYLIYFNIYSYCEYYYIFQLCSFLLLFFHLHPPLQANRSQLEQFLLWSTDTCHSAIRLWRVSWFRASFHSAISWGEYFFAHIVFLLWIPTGTTSWGSILAHTMHIQCIPPFTNSHRLCSLALSLHEQFF